MISFSVNPLCIQALNLVVIGGDATLEQAIKLKNEWSDHVFELTEDGTIR